MRARIELRAHLKLEIAVDSEMTRIMRYAKLCKNLYAKFMHLVVDCLLCKPLLPPCSCHAADTPEASCARSCVLERGNRKPQKLCLSHGAVVGRAPSCYPSGLAARARTKWIAFGLRDHTVPIRAPWRLTRLRVWGRRVSELVVPRRREGQASFLRAPS